ncbi:MAG: hypothetical protein FJX51_04005 [Alphaproteobacteria bacterium]|nr:hypothetical protein [Alphaproteobacteria bacterium]
MPRTDECRAFRRSDEAKLAADPARYGRARVAAISNPEDRKDHRAGVWTLAPTRHLKDQNRARSAVIGEGDRFRVTFAKPAA